MLTDLVLIHYHKRSSAQLMKKTLNAWTGKGYPLDASFAPDRGGTHNRQPVADILAGRVPAAQALSRGDVDLAPFAAHLRTSILGVFPTSDE